MAALHLTPSVPGGLSEGAFMPACGWFLCYLQMLQFSGHFNYLLLKSGERRVTRDGHTTRRQHDLNSQQASHEWLPLLTAARDGSPAQEGHTLPADGFLPSTSH